MKNVVISLGLLSSVVIGSVLAHANENDENMQKGNNKSNINYYKTYENKGTLVGVISPKDAADSGKNLKQNRLKITTPDASLDPTGVAGQSPTPSGS